MFFEQKLSHSHGCPPSLCPPADRSGTDDLGHCLTIPGICEPRLEKSAPLTTLGASSIPPGRPVFCLGGAVGTNPFLSLGGDGLGCPNEAFTLRMVEEFSFMSNLSH